MSLFKKYNNVFLLIAASLVTGILGGAVGAAFYHTLHFANDLRGSYPWLIYFLTLGGILTVLIYKLLKVEKQEINDVFSAVKEHKRVSPLLFPAVFLGTVITQLFGGSAGKEGAAVQIGAGISSSLIKRLRLEKQNNSIILLCGIASVFAAVFTTPLTAIAFALETVFISRKFYFKAVLPISLSSLSAFFVSRLFDVKENNFNIGKAPNFSLKLFAVIFLCVAGAILFCLAIEGFSLLFKRIFKNEFLRITVGAVLITALTLLVGNQDYNGGGINVITEILESGQTVYYAFLLKILFTAITNAAGFKGGEIVPALFVGAALGAAVGGLIGFSPVFSAAVGMITVFSAATKCTAAAIILSLEFFGLSGVGYFAVSAVIARLLSFNIGLYNHNKSYL